MLPADLVAKLNQCATTDFAGPRDHWFNWLAGFTTMVAVGLLFELPELVYELKGIVGDRIPRFGHWVITSQHRIDAAKAIAFIGWFLIVAGVAGERVAEVRVKDFDVRIQECSDAKVQAATIEAGDAVISAKTAHDEADVVKNETDALNADLKVASGQLDNLKSDTLALSPRWRLLQNDEGTFVKVLEPFAGQQITIVRCGNEDREQFDFEFALAQVWSKVGWVSGVAQWDQCPLIGWNEIHFVSSAGNFADRWAGIPAAQSIRPTCGPKGKTAGDALCNVLNDLRTRTVAFEERATPDAIIRAKLLFGDGSPAEMALKDPNRIFLLIGHASPMFTKRQKHPNKSDKTK
jgi:hypothetical protein